MAAPLPPISGPAPIAAPGQKKDFTKTPQEIVSEFWDKYFAKKPGRVTSIFPRALYETLLPDSRPRGLSSAANAAESYEAAARECREKVRRIVRECNRTNEKFTDPDFDIEADPNKNCLNGLVRDESGEDEPHNHDHADHAAPRTGATTAAPHPCQETPSGTYETAFPNGQGQAVPRTLSAPLGGRHGVRAGETYEPGSVHRVDWIFESPKFTVEGYSSSDIKQGGNGDCWWLAAVATIAHRKDLMDRVCVARDEDCGVYGFVFQRDGEWVSVVVDDNLYLLHPDFDYYGDTYDATGRRAREHRRRYQTGSEALYFARCADPNETWLPLLEKAYAKVHGDYEAISGGWSGEGVEDMTGGVTTTIATNRVLKKDKLWRELVNSDGDFVFALSAIGTGWDWKKGGLALGHAYSVLRATEEVDEEGNKVRLVKIRNPWGERAYNGIGEWNGPWSDGSKEWTPYWLKKLDHKFGDDGIFWMSYRDMLDTFLFLHRTRLFDEKWTVVQQWTSVNVGWVSGYLNTKFLIEIKKAGNVVIVMTQLDERYFLGLEGQYEFSLHFLLQEEGGGKPGEHLARVRPVHAWENRSVSCEVELEAGRYEVVPKVTATRYASRRMVEDVVAEYADKNPQKLRQVGVQYDLAHAKGGVPDEDEMLMQRKKREKEKAERRKRRLKAKAKRAKEKKKQRGRAKRRVEVDLKVEVVESADKAKEKKEEKKEDGGEGREEKGEQKQEQESEEKKEDKGEQKEKESHDKEEKKDQEEAKEKSAGVSTKGDKNDPPSRDNRADEAKSASSSEGGPTPSSSTDLGTTRTVAVEEKKDKAESKSEDSKEDGVDNAESDNKGDDANDDDDDDDDDNDDDSDETSSDSEDDTSPPPDYGDRVPWNAVCVLGLRVYATNPGVSIELVKPKDAEEAASLSVDSVPAGATM